MATPPRIVGERPQPITTGNVTVSNSAKFRAQYIIFESQGGPEGPVQVEVLAGEGAPTPSGGYAKWAKIQRPQRVALTVLEGYEPMMLTVPVLFDAVRNNGVREDVENQIQWLEWMGGRGIKKREPFNVGVGTPPLLVVYSAEGNGANMTPLVPAPFQSPNTKWFIEDMAWDEHPLKDAAGARIRQAATVHLVQYVKDPAQLSSTKESYSTHGTTRTLNTLRKLVLHYAKGTPAHREEAVRETLKENAHNKKIGSSPTKSLPEGTQIRIAHRFLVP